MLFSPPTTSSHRINQKLQSWTSGLIVGAHTGISTISRARFYHCRHNREHWTLGQPCIQTQRSHTNNIKYQQEIGDSFQNLRMVFWNTCTFIRYLLRSHDNHFYKSQPIFLQHNSDRRRLNLIFKNTSETMTIGQFHNLKKSYFQQSCCWEKTFLMDLNLHLDSTLEGFQWLKIFFFLSRNNISVFRYSLEVRNILNIFCLSLNDSVSGR